jgi:23S rRNA pseudouridine1911/1915/1917 synthase
MHAMTRATHHSPLEVLYIDDRIVVVNKPAGMLSVAAEGGRSRQKTVMGELGGRLRIPGRFFPCHRLDRETTGVLLVARDRDAWQFYEAAWAQVDKHYLALVRGVVRTDDGTIQLPLQQDPRTFEVSVTTANNPHAQAAITHWQRVWTVGQRSLLRVQLDTGRKHQIRVHLAHLGHPVCGDARYGAGRADGTPLCLHAHELHLPHPTHAGKRVVVAPPPTWSVQPGDHHPHKRAATRAR